MPDAGRVITGAAAGRRLLAPGPGTRPLADRVKQALFAIVEAESEEAWAAPALDLYAGSGAAGIEALSRGAPACVFVERDAGAARAIAANLERTGLRGGRVVRRDALGILAAGAASMTEAPFGLVVVDPPYEDVTGLASALERLGDPRLGWLRHDSVVVAKHFWRTTLPTRAGLLRRRRERRFGETALTVYRPADARDEQEDGG